MDSLVNLHCDYMIQSNSSRILSGVLWLSLSFLGITRKLCILGYVFWCGFPYLKFIFWLSLLICPYFPNIYSYADTRGPHLPSPSCILLCITLPGRHTTSLPTPEVLISPSIPLLYISHILRRDRIPLVRNFFFDIFIDTQTIPFWKCWVCKPQFPSIQRECLSKQLLRKLSLIPWWW